MFDLFNFSLLSKVSQLGVSTAQEIYDFFGLGTASSNVINTLSNLASSPIDYIQSGFIQVLAGILSFLPDGGTLPQPVHDASQTLGSFLYNTSYIFPVYDLMFIIALIFTLKVTLFGLRVILWGISMVRGNAFGSPF